MGLEDMETDCPGMKAPRKSRTACVERCEEFLAIAKTHYSAISVTPAQARLAQAAMENPDSLVAELATELHVKPVSLYRHVGPRGEHQP